MYISRLWLIKKDANLKTLAFLKDDQYRIQNHNSSANLLILDGKLNDNQKILFAIWSSLNCLNI